MQLKKKKTPFVSLRFLIFFCFLMTVTLPLCFTPEISSSHRCNFAVDLKDFCSFLELYECAAKYNFLLTQLVPISFPPRVHVSLFYL